MNTSDLRCFFLPVHWQQTGQDITVSIASCVLSSMFALTTVLGNGAIMLVIWKTRALHSPSSTLLFCLAATDLLVGLIGQPSFVAFKIAELLEKFKAYCDLRMTQFVFGWTTCGSSFIILSVISIDRLLALTLHLRYDNTMTVARAVAVALAVWVLCAVLTISKFWLGDKWIILPAIIAIVTFITTAFSTCKIFSIARKHLRQINEQNQTMINLQNCTVDVLRCKKSAVTVIYVYATMLIFYLPFVAVMIVETIDGVTRTVKLAYDVTTTAVFINSTINPVIYCWRMKQIRHAFKNYLKDLTIFSQHY